MLTGSCEGNENVMASLLGVHSTAAHNILISYHAIIRPPVGQPEFAEVKSLSDSTTTVYNLAQLSNPHVNEVIPFGAKASWEVPNQFHLLE